VAVEELATGGAGGGVVVDAGALDVGPVTPGGGVVDAKQQTLALQQGIDGAEQLDGHPVCFAAGGPDGGVSQAELVLDT
jgi:hypothetical protein